MKSQASLDLVIKNGDSQEARSWDRSEGCASNKVGCEDKIEMLQRSHDCGRGKNLKLCQSKHFL